MGIDLCLQVGCTDCILQAMGASQNAVGRLLNAQDNLTSCGILYDIVSSIPKVSVSVSTENFSSRPPQNSLLQMTNKMF